MNPDNELAPLEYTSMNNIEIVVILMSHTLHIHREDSYMLCKMHFYQTFPVGPQGIATSVTSLNNEPFK